MIFIILLVYFFLACPLIGAIMNKIDGNYYYIGYLESLKDGFIFSIKILIVIMALGFIINIFN